MPQLQAFTLNKTTTRERDVLSSLAEGLTAKEIASRYHLSTHTVNTHKQNLMTKMECRNTVELVVKAIRGGVIDLN